MLAKRGCQQQVYTQNTTSATGEQANFASSLIVLVLIYKSAWKGRGGERSSNFAGKSGHIFD